MLGAAFGSLAGGWISTFVGRRLTLLLFGLPVCAAWFLLAFAADRWTVYFVRTLMGLACSVAYVNIGVYISETTYKSRRNMFGAFQTISLTLGFVLAYVTCHFVDWRTASKILSVVPLLSSLAMVFLPETPYWLVEKGRYDQAK